MPEKLTLNSSDIPFIVESINHPLWSADIQGKITFHNTAFANCWHLFFNTYPSTLSEIVANLKGPEKLEWKTAFEQALLGKRQKKDLVISKDKQIIHFELSTNPIFDDKFNIKGATFICYDITEKIKALQNEEQLRSTVMFLEKTALDFMSITSEDAIHEYVSECIYELVPESIVVSCSFEEEQNELVSRYVCGINKEVKFATELLGNDIVNLNIAISDDVKNQIILNSNKLVEIQGGLYSLLNGSLSPFLARRVERLLRINKVYRLGIVKSGKLLGAVVVFTRYFNTLNSLQAVEALVHQASVALQRSKAEGELIKAKEKAEESDRLKSAFLANISHEIRTPVNGILGFIQLLEMDDSDSERRKEFLEIIRSNSHALLAILEDILDISMIEENQIKFQYETICLNGLLDEVLTNYSKSKYLNTEKNIKFKIKKGEKDTDALFFTDSVRVRQILNNLIGNAFKFTDQGLIEVGYIKEDESVRFFVKDTGIGIDIEKAEQLFKPFVQADNCFSRRYGGSGLGLAISSGLLKQMGGAIWVESEPDKGSVFYFTLPINSAILKKTVQVLPKESHPILN